MRRFRAVVLGLMGAGLCCATAAAATPEVSTSFRLQDRREVTAGQRSYAEGFEDGRFYANGWHITGEMGGVWAPPIKLADGVWFGLDDATAGSKVSWVGPATRFFSGWGYTRYELPSLDGLSLQRIDFAPDTSRAVLFGLRMTNPGAAKTVTVTVDAHSELLAAYPWSFSGMVPNAANNDPDHGSFDGSSLVFTDDGNLGGTAPTHHYAALVGSDRAPAGGEAAATGGGDRGPQPDTACAAADGTAHPSACNDGPYGRGTGGQLRYRITIGAHATQTLWVAVAGSDRGLADARAQLAGAVSNPAGELARKVASRVALADHTVVSLPGDPLMARAIAWGKQNLADETQSASDLHVRWTNQGKQYPAPLATIARARWFAAGYPDYPWIFATDGEYTAFAAVAVGQFATIEDHLRALRDISDILNNRSGIVAHETVSTGDVYFGHDSQTVSGTTTTNDFNTDETVKFPSAVALVWRWTGDNHFRDEMYDFAQRNMRVIDRKYSVSSGGWPLGSGNVERTGMGPVKIDNGVYYMRGLYDLADMARSKHDAGTARWATRLANKLRREFEATWWDPAAQQYADSLNEPGNVQVFQKYWIGVVPMEASLTTGTRTTPGVAVRAHAVRALNGRENTCYSGARPGNLGLFHTGCNGGGDGKGDYEIFSLENALMAVAEGNYGRLGPGQQRRYLDANAESMFAEPATANTPDEQPGSLPEILPSTPAAPSNPAGGIPPNIDRCWTCRSSVMQAWGNYDIYAVVTQQLGVRPFLNDSALQVVPQVPEGQGSVAGSDIRLGGGWLNVFASHVGRRYTTRMALRGLRLRSVWIGQTLPFGASPRRVELDGHRVRHVTIRVTNRGVEVTVAVHGAGLHTLIVTS